MIEVSVLKIWALFLEVKLRGIVQNQDKVLSWDTPVILAEFSIEKSRVG